MADVKWSGKAIDRDGKDLATPAVDLLQKLNVLEDPLELRRWAARPRS